MQEKDLIRLKQDINQTKIDISKLEGQKEHLLKELKTKWKCNSTAEAKEKLKAVRLKIENLNAQITIGLKDLEKKYDTDPTEEE
jgi:hypothetical protein